jgi:hypothetical protein
MQILCVLKKLDVTSKFHAVAVFVTVALQILFPI